MPFGPLQLSMKLLQQCPSCRARLQPSNVRILRETETMFIGHMSCNTCLVNYVTHIVANPQGIVGNALLTDASYGESRQFIDGKSINENVFLALYKKINDNSLISAFKSDLKHRNHHIL